MKYGQVQFNCGYLNNKMLWKIENRLIDLMPKSYIKSGKDVGSWQFWQDVDECITQQIVTQ